MSLTPRSDYQDSLPVTRDKAGKPTALPSPKVLAGIASSGSLVVVVAILSAITPDLFAALGPWGPVAFAGVTALAGFLGSYIKRPAG